MILLDHLLNCNEIYSCGLKKTSISEKDVSNMWCQALDLLHFDSTSEYFWGAQKCRYLTERWNKIITVPLNHLIKPIDLFAMMLSFVCYICFPLLGSPHTSWANVRLWCHLFILILVSKMLLSRFGSGNLNTVEMWFWNVKINEISACCKTFSIIQQVVTIQKYSVGRFVLIIIDY